MLQVRCRDVLERLRRFIVFDVHAMSTWLLERAGRPEGVSSVPHRHVSGRLGIYFAVSMRAVPGRDLLDGNRCRLQRSLSGMPSWLFLSWPRGYE